MNKVKERIKEVISKSYMSNLSPEEIREEMTLVDDLSFDSLGFVQMILDIESTFGIKFDEEYVSMDKLVTVKDVINYVEEKTK